MKSLIVSMFSFLVFCSQVYAQLPGSEDPTFSFKTRFNGDVTTMSLQEDGKILVAGEFTKYNKKTANRVARINPDGSLDDSFNVGIGPTLYADPTLGYTKDLIYDIKIESDGKIILAGEFNYFNGIPKSYIVRLNEDGSIDFTFDTPDFDSGLQEFISSVEIQADGKYVVAGDLYYANSQEIGNMLRLNRNGGIDGSFQYRVEVGAGVYYDDKEQQFATIASTTVQSDGKIIVVGNFTFAGGQERANIARFNSDGTLDESYDPGSAFDDPIKNIALDEADKLVVSGQFTAYNGNSVNGIARLNADGTLDNSFQIGQGPDGSITNHKILAEGKILVFGDYTTLNGSATQNLTLLNADGSVDNTFNAGTASNEILTTLQAPNGDLYLGGNFNEFNDTVRNHFVSVNADGALNNNFEISTGANGSIYAVKTLESGKILIGGKFSEYNGFATGNLARINADGTLDQTFEIGTGIGPAVDGSVRSLAVQSTGKILVGGRFTIFNDQNVAPMIRLNENGTLDETFVFGENATGAVGVIKVLENDEIFVGGGFSPNGTSRYGLAKLFADGQINSAFELNVNTSVADFDLQTDGKIVYGGPGGSFGSGIREQIARINSDGSLDDSFYSGNFGSSIDAVKIQENGKVLVGGNFSSFDGQDTGKFLRLNTDGTLDESFQIGSGASSDVEDIKILSNGEIIIAGLFFEFNENNASRLAKLTPDGVLINDFEYQGPYFGQFNSIDLLEDGSIIAGGLEDRFYPQNLVKIVNGSLSLAPSAQALELNVQQIAIDSINILFTQPFNKPSGYLVSRYNKEVEESSEPKDAVYYSKGDRIGNGRVIAIGADTAVVDNLSFNSETDYIYKVFSYNEGSDQLINYWTVQPPEDSLTTWPSIPTKQPLNLEFSDIQSDRVNLTYDLSGLESDGVLVVRKQGSVPLISPFLTQDYQEGDSIGEGVVAYRGSSSSFADTGLLFAREYFYKIYSYNEGDGVFIYNLEAPLTGQVQLPMETPESQPTNLEFVNVKSTSYTVEFSDAEGNPDGYLMLRSDNEIEEIELENNIFYSLGMEIGNAAVIYVGDSTSVNQDDVQEGKTYYYNIFSYLAYKDSIRYAVEAPLAGSFASYDTTPQVLEFSKSSAQPNDQITISGEFFSSTADENVVKFNGVQAEVLNAATTELTVVVPDEATSGLVSVKVRDQIGISEDPLIISNLLIEDIIDIELLSNGVDNVVSVQVNDNQNVLSASLKWRGITSGQNATMNSKELAEQGNSYSVILPLEDPIGITYEIEFTDSRNQKILTNSFYAHKYYVEDSEEQKMKELNFGGGMANYQLISLPYSPRNKDVYQVFSDLGFYDQRSWRFFSFDGEENIEAGDGQEINLGKGFWLIVRDEQEINLGRGAVFPVTPDSLIALSINEGWNLIGNPYPIAMNWSDVLNFNQVGSGVGELKLYNNGVWEEKDVLEPFQGAFVYSSQDNLNLEIPLTASTSNANRILDEEIANNTEDWELSFTMKQSDLKNELFTLGMKTNAEDTGIDDFDEPSLSMPDNLKFPQLSVNHEDVNLKFSKDFVKPTNWKVWDVGIDSDGSNNPVGITWNKEEILNNPYELILLDEQTGLQVDMKSSDSYEFSPKINSLQIIYGNNSDVEEYLLGKLMRLGFPYPNPAKGKVSIPVSLNSNSEVKLSIIDMKGNLVELITDDQLEKGNYEFSWSNMSKVKGLYFVKLTLNGKQYYRKLVLN